MDPAGTPKIEVTFEIDVKGLPSVKAVDLTTESEKKFFIEGSFNLDEAKVQNLVDERKVRRDYSHPVTMFEVRSHDSFLKASSGVKKKITSGKIDEEV